MRNNHRRMSTRTLAYCSLLVALNVVLSRLIGLMPDPSTRFSIEAIPIFLAGLFFGPVAGGMVGFSADFVGCLFSAFGYNPIFCIPPILYGVFGGLLRHFIAKKTSIWRLALSFLPPVLLGSILYQSATLAYMYYEGAFLEGFLIKLSTRSIQFGITLVIDVAVIYLLMRTNVFTRMGIWPPVKKERKSTT